MRERQDRGVVGPAADVELVVVVDVGAAQLLVVGLALVDLRASTSASTCLLEAAHAGALDADREAQAERVAAVGRETSSRAGERSGANA